MALNLFNLLVQNDVDKMSLTCDEMGVSTIRCKEARDGKDAEGSFR
jgi:hypothetical protein